MIIGKRDTKSLSTYNSHCCSAQSSVAVIAQNSELMLLLSLKNATISCKDNPKKLCFSVSVSTSFIYKYML